MEQKTWLMEWSNKSRHQFCANYDSPLGGVYNEKRTKKEIY